MNNTKIILAFLGGGIIGSFITWRYLKDKYETITQNEIDSVKKSVFRERRKTESHKSHDGEHADESDKENDYQSILREEGYAGNGKEETPVETPYVISPEEFGEFDGYEKI